MRYFVVQFHESNLFGGDYVAYRHIRELRESKQLTQQEIAKVLQVTQECYSRYEGGQRDIPTKTLIKLADFHNTTIDYLLDRTAKQTAL